MASITKEKLEKMDDDEFIRGLVDCLSWEEKVPRDGTLILALHPNRKNVQVINWSLTVGCWMLGGTDLLPLPENQMPTHYMLIPDLPEV